MLWRTVIKRSEKATKMSLPSSPETDKRTPMKMEVGVWLYNRETMNEFQRWCTARGVRAYGNIKMFSNPHYARCLRTTREIGPGEAIITAPASSCFNFLTVAREMFETPSQCFPLPLDWMNYQKTVPWLPTRVNHEISTAGWMARIVSLHESGYSPYIQFLMEDTRGKDGIATGISREKEALEDKAGVLDHYLSEMAIDACEEPEDFLEHFFIGLACLLNRSQPVEKEAIEYFIRGTDFFKAKAAEMHVPTLMPLIDCVPQKEDDSQNTVVEYFPYRGEQDRQDRLKELGVLAREEEKGFTFTREITEGGFFALRAMTRIEKGDVLYVRRFPRQHYNEADKARMDYQTMDATRMLSHE